MEFETYSEESAKTDIRPDPADPVVPLLGLVGEAGSLVSEFKKRLRFGDGYLGFEEEVKEDLGDLLWYAAALARTIGLPLDEVASANLQKARSIFSEELPNPSQYDEGFPASESLARTFEIRFEEREEKGVSTVFLYEGDTTVGDPLDDNSADEDFFRFHDALHLANAAILGWSPTFRSLVERKRRSDPETDRVQDGARAIFLEEGLVAYVFSVARDVSFFENAQRVDWDVLKVLRRMTGALEVSDRSLSEWQHMILTGFQVWRALRDHGGGLVIGDLDKRTLRWMP